MNSFLHNLTYTTPPRGSPAEQTVRRVAEQLGRIEGRQIRTRVVVLTLKRSPRLIGDERGKAEEHNKRLYPPGVATRRFAETTHWQRNLNSVHGLAAPKTSRQEVAKTAAATGSGRLVYHPKIDSAQGCRVFCDVGWRGVFLRRGRGRAVSPVSSAPAPTTSSGWLGAFNRLKNSPARVLA